MEISPEAQSHISTDKEVCSPVSPPHQEAPVGTKHRPREGVPSPSQGIAAGQFSIGQGNKQGETKSEHKSQECPRTSASGCRTDQYEDPTANRATNAKCDCLTQCQYPAEGLWTRRIRIAHRLTFHWMHRFSSFVFLYCRQVARVALPGFLAQALVRE